MITAKVVLIGDSGSGKTSIRNRYFYNRYSEYYKSTIGADFNSKVVHVGKEQVNLMIWDTAGQERFAALSNAFFRGADVAVLVFDASKAPDARTSRHWYETFRATCPVHDRDLDDFCFVAVGNKVDRVDEVKVDQGQRHLDILRQLQPASTQFSPLKVRPLPVPSRLILDEVHPSNADVRQSIYYTPSSSLNTSAMLKEPAIQEIQEKDINTTENEDTDDDESSSIAINDTDKGFKLFWTSAETGEGIEEVFEYIAKYLVYRDMHKKDTASLDRSRLSTFNIEAHDCEPDSNQLFINSDSLSTTSIQFHNYNARKNRKRAGCC